MPIILYVLYVLAYATFIVAAQYVGIIAALADDGAEKGVLHSWRTFVMLLVSGAGLGLVIFLGFDVWFLKTNMDGPWLFGPFSTNDEGLALDVLEAASATVGFLTAYVVAERARRAHWRKFFSP